MDGPGCVAVAGGKGGCGKTTATLGLAAALANRGRQPVAVDADVDLPDLHIEAGVTREPGLPAVARAANPLDLARYPEEWHGVAVVPSGVGSAGVGRALKRLAAVDRPVLLDCPAGAGPDVARPLRLADATIIVRTATRASRTDAAKTARIARALDAPAVAWVEREASGGQPPPAGGEQPIAVPRVDGSPLADPAVRGAFDRLATAVFR